MYSWNTVSKGMLKMPVTCVTFRPTTDISSTRNIALVAGAGGVVQHWHITSGRMVNSITEEKNQVYSLAYREDAKYFATVGKDSCLRIYDEHTNALESTLKGGNNLVTAGHANRIFAVKWTPFDPNCLISGGWDNTIQIWDKRQEHAVRRIYGPHICGDAIDIDRNGRVLTGSWRQENQLQLWEFSSGKLIDTIPLQEDTTTKAKCNIYTARFNDRKHPGLIIYGGSGANEARILETRSNKTLGAITGLKGAIYSSAVTSDLSRIAFAGGNGSIYVLGMSGTN